MELKEGTYRIGGVSVEDLASTAGTPVYVYDAGSMERQVRRLRAAYAPLPLRIMYACKALPNLAVLRWMKELGCGFDLVSAQEVELALRAGFAPQDILFPPNMVAYAEYQNAVELGVHINIDSLSMLEHFGHDFGDRVPVCIRFNPHIMAGGHERISTGHVDSKFGISIHQLRHVQRVMASTGLRVNVLLSLREDALARLDVFKARIPGLTDKGGGIYNFGKNGDCIPALYDCTFNGNDVTSGGSIYNDGTFGGQCNMIAEDCLYEYNSTTSDGGALYNAAFEGEASPQIRRSTFRFNHSGGAGTAMFNNGDSGFSEPEITDCLFYANTADTYGGAMYNQGKSGHSSPVITNCLFYNNSASSAGAIYNLGAEGGHPDAIITNCTFYGSNANVGGAIYCNASDNGNSTPVITNCIFKRNNAN